MFPVFVGTYYLDIRNWYDGSVLMGNKVVFSPEGKRLIEFEDNDLGDDRMLSVFCKEPSSYTHIIRLMHARMWLIIRWLLSTNMIWNQRILFGA